MRLRQKNWRGGTSEVIGAFYSSEPLSCNEELSPAFQAMAIDIVMALFADSDIRVTLENNHYFHGDDPLAWKSDWLDIRACILASGACYVSWHPHPKTGEYWPLVAVFADENEALLFLRNFTERLIVSDVSFVDMLQAEPNPAVLPVASLMRERAIQHLAKTGVIRLPGFLDMAAAWVFRRNLPEFFWSARILEYGAIPYSNNR